MPSALDVRRSLGRRFAELTRKDLPVEELSAAERESEGSLGQRTFGEAHLQRLLAAPDGVLPQSRVPLSSQSGVSSSARPSSPVQSAGLCEAQRNSDGFVFSLALRSAQLVALSSKVLNSLSRLRVKALARELELVIPAPRLLLNPNSQAEAAFSCAGLDSSVQRHQVLRLRERPPIASSAKSAKSRTVPPASLAA